MKRYIVEISDTAEKDLEDIINFRILNSYIVE